MSEANRIDHDKAAVDAAPVGHRILRCFPICVTMFAPRRTKQLNSQLRSRIWIRKKGLSQSRKWGYLARKRSAWERRE